MSGSERTRLMDRDRQLLALLAEARYLTTAQVQRIAYPGRAEVTVRRRLTALAGEGSHAMPRPLLRRLAFRTPDARLTTVWAPTAAGYIEAEAVLGRLPRVPREDVGQDFLEHAVTLNEFFVGLLAGPLLARAPASLTTGPLRDMEARVERGRRLATFYARASHPAFRWDAVDSVRLPWKEFDASNKVERDRLIQPDGVLELPAAKRRIFLECEMGGHSIAALSDEKQGATLAKVGRYTEYLASFADVRAKKTYYAEQYSDGFVPEVLFLVKTESRATSINEAIAASRSLAARASLKTRALTFTQAPNEFLPLLGVEVPSERGAASGAGALTEGEVKAVHAFYRSVHAFYKARRDKARASKEPVPEYPQGIAEVHRLLAERGLEKAP